MAKILGAIVIDEERCKGCSLCCVACPHNVLSLTTKKVNQKGYQYASANEDAECIGCSSCAIVCPDGCITVYRKRID